MKKTKNIILHGFTLIEMMVVISIIAIAATISIPSIIGIFNAGADAQAHNLLAAQLASARALAIQKATFAGVHVQMANVTTPTNNLADDICYMAIVWDDPATTGNHDFTLASDTEPRPMPGNIAFGQLRNPFIVGSNYSDLSDIIGFTSFTIVFSPSGQVITQPNGTNVTLAVGSLCCATGSNPSGTQLWASPNAQAGATAVTMFDYTELNAAANPVTYLDEYGQLIPINVYTGQLFLRK